ncbi:hypothetical protein [Chitiniphilus shinanonensis]|uniref:hypothetical protein n=1 Tax=Chitiniphilus shinanonensis TaxID=553088 RepID=UPI003031AF5F
MESYLELEGVDCIWLGRDSLGRMAAFVTAGVGPIPKDVLSKIGMPILDIEQFICDSLPKSTTGKMLIDVPRPDDFLDLSNRGFFVYDWPDVHRKFSERSGCYELISVPEAPINIEDVPNFKNLRIYEKFDLEFFLSKKIEII